MRSCQVLAIQDNYDTSVSSCVLHGIKAQISKRIPFLTNCRSLNHPFSFSAVERREFRSAEPAWPVAKPGRLGPALCTALCLGGGMRPLLLLDGWWVPFAGGGMIHGMGLVDVTLVLLVGGSLAKSSDMYSDTGDTWSLVMSSDISYNLYEYILAQLQRIRV